MLKRLLLAALIVTASPAIAQAPQVPISGLPPATVPLSGTEQIPIVQAGVTRRVPANAMPIIAPTTTTIGGVMAGTAPTNQVMIGIAPGTGLPLFAQQSFANLSGLIAPSQIPAPTATAFGGMLSATAPTNQFQTGNIAGVPQFAQPNFSNVAGTVAPTQLPAPTGSTLGGVQSGTAGPNQFQTGISAAGVPTFAQPAFSGISGTVAASQLAAGAALANLGYTPVNQTTSVVAGAGLTGGGTLASNVTLALAQPSSSVLGGILAASAPANQFMTGVGSTGAPAFAQPSFAGLAGQIAASQVPTSVATMVNGQTCPIGGSCTITASAGTITAGSGGTTVSGGMSNGLLYNNAGTLATTGTANNAVAVTNGSGVPSVSTTLPSGLTIPTPALSSPTVSGTLGGTGVVPNAALVNATISGTPLGGTLPILTFGTHFSGTSYNGSTAVTLATDATNANLVSTIVARDASGNFAAGTVTAALTGHASLDLPLAGGTMSGAIAMGGNAISGAGAISGSSLTDTGLSTQGATCNSAAGAISTSATGCPGVVQGVASGGTGTGTASGTAVDNISAFSGTGLMRRTGAGAYSFGTTVAIAEGGTGATTALAARLSLGIDGACVAGDAAYTIAATCRQVQIKTAPTAARTYTLPPAASFNSGFLLSVQDFTGGVTSSNSIAIAGNGSDTVNGASSATISTGYGGGFFESDGTSKWAYTPQSSGGGSGTVSSITAGPGLSAQGGPAGGTISTSGTIQLADQQRRNQVLGQINVAKALGTAQRYVGVFADGFADTTGASVTNATINTASKNVTTIIMMSNSQGPNTLGTSDTSLSGYTFREVVAGSALSNLGNSITYVSLQCGSSGATIGPAYIGTPSGSYGFTSPVQLLFSGSSTTACTANGTVTGQATYTLTSSGVTVSVYFTGSEMRTSTSTTGVSTYYSGSTTNDASNPSPSGYASSSGIFALQQIQSGNGTANNMTLVANYQTADATVANARAAIVLNASASPTWGTSDTMEVTCNGGTNWQAATPVSGGVVQAGSSQSGGTMWETPDTACAASGTSFAARYKTLTNQSRTVYGLSTTVRP